MSAGRPSTSDGEKNPSLVPDGPQTSNGATNSSSTPIPPAVKEMEQELLDLIRKKHKLDRSLVDLEYRLYQLEGSYLEDTFASGSIVRGFEGYFGTRMDRKRGRQSIDHDRIFSHSSSTYQKSLEMKAEEIKHGEVSGHSIARSLSGTFGTPLNKSGKRSKHHLLSPLLGTPTPGAIRKKGIDRMSKRSRIVHEDLE